MNQVLSRISGQISKVGNVRALFSIIIPLLGPFTDKLKPNWKMGSEKKK